MKKVLLVSAFAVLALASCKKDYTCECTAAGAKATYQLKDVKKKDAQKSCDTAGATWITAGGTCTLK